MIYAAFERAAHGSQAQAHLQELQEPTSNIGVCSDTASSVDWTQAWDPTESFVIAIADATLQAAKEFEAEHLVS